MKRFTIIIKTILIAAIVLAAVYLVFLFIFPSEVFINSTKTENVTTSQLISSKMEPKTTEISPKKEISTSYLEKMFYKAVNLQPAEIEEIVPQQAVSIYDTSRFSYLGTISTNGKQQYMLKDNQFDFIFPISINEISNGIKLIEYNIEEQFLLLDSDTKKYKVNIK